MKKLFLMVLAIAGTGSATVGHAGACTLQRPAFEVAGIPISQHQVAVLGSAGVEESTGTPTLTLAGMPASPNQIAVLTRRAKTFKIAEASADSSQLTVGLTRPNSQRSIGLASCGSE